VSPHALVAGGAGFLGSHLCDRLLAENWEVTCIDSLATGREQNLHRALAHPRFRLRIEDLTERGTRVGPFDCVLHFAGLASPVDYLRHPIDSLATGSVATTALLEIARRDRARFILASSSEIYGTAQVHPQPEGYWGHVNPVGYRSAYDEAKRYAEAVSMAYRRTYGVEVVLVRLFNVYGSRMRPDDGRAVPTFIRQALRAEPLTVHGDGRQTRSLCFVDDVVEAVWRLVGSDFIGPINVGFPAPIPMRELAERVVKLCRSSSILQFVERPDDDPQDRCPDIQLARHRLGWEPRVPLNEGLADTIAWSRTNWGPSAVNAAPPSKGLEDVG
jgi:dTDP-glucose 4,6-dehydratase